MVVKSERNSDCANGDWFATKLLEPLLACACACEWSDEWCNGDGPAPHQRKITPREFSPGTTSHAIYRLKNSSIQSSQKGLYRWKQFFEAALFLYCIIKTTNHAH